MLFEQRTREGPLGCGFPQNGIALGSEQVSPLVRTVGHREVRASVGTPRAGEEQQAYGTDAHEPNEASSVVHVWL
jgi:hypothetical protein